MALIDSHVHYWRLSRGDYGWLSADNPALAPIHRDFGQADFEDAAAGIKIGSRILVQAAPTVDETRFLLNCARSDHAVAGVVGWVDLSSPDAVSDLLELAADPLLKSIRPMLQDLPDPDWITAAPRLDAVLTMKRLGLRFDALVTPVQLDALYRFAKANDDLPIMIDHAAKPAFAAQQGDPLHRLWSRGMERLAALPNVCCKLSGLLTELPASSRATTATAAKSLGDHVSRVLDWFGPGRLAWGSDWPVLTLAAGYPFWMAVTDILLGNLAPHERDAVLGGTASHFYGIEGHPQ